MRWFLAGLAFTVLVGLAVFTASLKSANVRCQKRLEELVLDSLSRSIERDRLAHSLRQATGREKLALRWQGHMRRATERTQ